MKKAAEQARAELGAKRDDSERARLARGLDQIASLWRTSDGDLLAFARGHFLPRGRELDATFDHTLLAGVPNNAFTEALAFVFQARDVQLLGVVKPGETDPRR